MGEEGVKGSEFAIDRVDARYNIIIFCSGKEVSLDWC